MSNPVVNRILSETSSFIPKKVLQVEDIEVESMSTVEGEEREVEAMPPPLDVYEYFRNVSADKETAKALESVMHQNQANQPEITTVSAVANSPTEAVDGKIEFRNIHDFSEFYRANKDKFSPEQVGFFAGLESVRESVFGGCNCTRGKREISANEYYKAIMLNNMDSGLAEKVKEISGAKTVSFKLGESLIYEK